MQKAMVDVVMIIQLACDFDMADQLRNFDLQKKNR